MTRSPRPPACTACGATLRAKSDPAAPGTRVHSGRGLCTRCWKRVVHGSKPKPERPAACTSCGRGWDQVAYTARGMCSGCYSTQRYRETREPARRAMPATCTACHRPLRRVGTPKTPGTVIFAGSGKCGSCFNASKKTGRAVVPRVTPTECSSCHRPMRTRARVAPGYVAHAGRGLCTTCYTANASRERALLAYVLGGAS